MSAPQRFLRDKSAAVFAELVVITAVVVTACLVAITDLRGDVDFVESSAVGVSGV